MPGKSHGQRSLVGYSAWGHKESDTTERISFLLMGVAVTPPVGCFPCDISVFEPTDCWLGPGLGDKMVTSRRPHANEYFKELQF